MALAEELSGLGFTLDRSARGAEHYVRRPNPYLTYWVHVRDEQAVFSWEFAIGEYVATLGLQIGSDERLNTFLYPRGDARGPADAAWVAREIEQTEALLDRVSLLVPGSEA